MGPWSPRSMSRHLTARDFTPFLRRAAGTRLWTTLLRHPVALESLARAQRSRPAQAARVQRAPRSGSAEYGLGTSFAREVASELAARRHDGTAAAAPGRPQGDPGLRVPRAVPRPARASCSRSTGSSARCSSALRTGVLTGRLVGANCRGAEKARRVREWLDGAGLADAVLWAYGDSDSDTSFWPRPSTASGWTGFGSCPNPGETPDVGHGRARFRGLRAAHRGGSRIPSPCRTL